MISLPRKLGQSVLIMGSAEVFVVKVEGDQVTLGIKTERHCKVVSRERYDDTVGKGLSPLKDVEGQTKFTYSHRVRLNSDTRKPALLRP